MMVSNKAIQGVSKKGTPAGNKTIHGVGDQSQALQNTLYWSHVLFVHQLSCHFWWFSWPKYGPLNEKKFFFQCINLYLRTGNDKALLGVEQAWTPILYLTDLLCKSLALPRDLSTYLVIISFEPSARQAIPGKGARTPITTFSHVCKSHLLLKKTFAFCNLLESGIAGLLSHFLNISE